ncbi:hypothetical protein CBM2588_A180014 [Cupriavidus taiwanensis]|nr:hypothetical protein CBM2588_A180014 [Cupriavidus taiwanensis]
MPTAQSASVACSPSRPGPVRRTRTATSARAACEAEPQRPHARMPQLAQPASLFPGAFDGLVA